MIIKNVTIHDPGLAGAIEENHYTQNRPGWISDITFTNVMVDGTPWVDLASSNLTLDAYVDANTILFIWGH